MLQIEREPAQYWSAHTHSRYSCNDAMPEVDAIVAKAKSYGQKAVGLTDHGNMAGTVELYQACKKEGLLPFPGSELYFVPDLAQYKVDYANRSKKAMRYHMGVLAYTTEGYENLVNLSTLSHKNHFHKPTLDFDLIAGLAEDGRTRGLAITTGCYFGYAVQSLVSKGENAVRQYLAALSQWFPDSVYVEMQNHLIDHGDGWNDDMVATAMMSIADSMGLPCIITQDSHYTEPEDKDAHDSLKRLVSWGDDTDDAVFPGDGFHMVNDRWMQAHHPAPRYQRGCEGLQHLVDRHTLAIPVLDSYSYSVPHVVHDAQAAMERRCRTRLAELGLEKTHWAKLHEEFEVIKAADMAGYMMLVAMVTDYMKENGIVFQTRGSAAGSCVCWLLGISSVDPIKWDLRFERFLSRDRTKPPDIDLDIAHDRREEIVAWLDTKFAAHQIGSWAVYGIEEDEEEGDRGSLKKKYYTALTKMLGPDEEKPKWADVDPDHKAMLYDLADRELYSGMGTNAAGVVITSTREEFERLVPLAYMASRGGFVTQYSKDYIEALGLVKLDVLGSKTLTVLRRCMDNLGLPIEQLEDIEFRDGPTYQLIRSGSTEGVFQLEGNTSKWGCKKLKPSAIKDVIAAMALFRTAAMKSGGTDAYVRRKHGKEEVPERHPALAKITAPTYGVLVYQEQVMDMLRYLGMDPENMTKFLKAVKASNKEIRAAVETIKGYQEWISQRCEEEGFNEGDRQFLDEAIAGFAEYGFNRAHATVYGITAYRCAYLAARHPLEFHAALLAVAAGDKKEPGYLRATRKRGVRVLQPHVNVSGDTYTVDRDRGAIRKGLRSIDGVGEKSAAVLAALAPYRDLSDLMERTPNQPITGGGKYDGTPDSLTGVLRALRDGGALSGL
jgi:DNA polymerase-3 subunit alpha